MDNMSLISIIVPVYNVEDYLKCALNALLSQSYRKLEIILIDDGSTDSSGNICDQYAYHDSRIRVIHKTNGGVSSARNSGLDIATGEYIGFFDPDDWPDRDLYRILYDTSMKYNAEVSICGHYIHTSNADIEERSFPYLAGVINQYEALLYFVSMSYYEGFLWNKLFSTKLIRRAENGMKLYFDEDIHITEDAIFVCKCLKEAKRIAYSPRPLYNYVVRDGSLTRSFNLEKKFTEKEGWKQVAQMLPSDLASLAMERYYTVAVNILRSAVMFGTKDEVSVLQKITKSYMHDYWCTSNVKFRNKLRASLITYFPYISDKVWLLIKKLFHVRWR